MRAFLKTILVVIILLFAAGWLNGDRLRYLGDKTGLPMWGRMATVADTTREAIDSGFERTGEYLTERIDALRGGMMKHGASGSPASDAKK